MYTKDLTTVYMFFSVQKALLVLRVYLFEPNGVNVDKQIQTFVKHQVISQISFHWKMLKANLTFNLYLKNCKVIIFGAS